MDDLIVCGMPEQIVMNAVCSWPDKKVPWTVMDSLPGMPDDVFLQNLALGFDWWKPYCGVQPSYVTSASQARLLVYVRRIDGANGILAQCELPCGASQVKMTLDVSEPWLTELSPAQRGILLRLVVAHEAGHGYGMGHAPAGSKNLMAPAYNAAIAGAGPWDLAESMMRYGYPIPKPPTPTPPTNPPTPGKNRLIVEFDGTMSNPRIVEPTTPTITPHVPPTPTGGSPVNSATLKTIRAFLDMAGMVTALTPNTIDDKVVTLLKQILDSILAGNELSTEQITAVHQALNIQV